ncbi:hypothetical protein EDB84DRAFT_1140978 [Lactarius hengduanensis]|nr:hypothetical protein EDB84DRAFT_1140978 [Lactarius hengduanensis]
MKRTLVSVLVLDSRGHLSTRSTRDEYASTQYESEARTGEIGEVHSTPPEKAFTSESETVRRPITDGPSSLPMLDIQTRPTNRSVLAQSSRWRTLTRWFQLPTRSCRSASAIAAAVVAHRVSRSDPRGLPLPVHLLLCQRLAPEIFVPQQAQVPLPQLFQLQHL